MTELSAMLTDGQVERYRTDGFAVVRHFLNLTEVAEIRGAFMDFIANGPVAGLCDAGYKFSHGDPLARYPRVMQPHRHRSLPIGQLAMRYLLDRRTESVLRDLHGEEPIAAQSMFYYKPPGARGQALHQDNFYLRVKPGTCTAAWIAIDDATPENGGMVVVPGTGEMPVACPQTADNDRFFTRDYVPVPDGLTATPVLLSAGDALFFTGSLIHGSNPNTSDRFRRAFICHYVPRSCVEVSHWYRPLLSFDGNEVNIEDAMGGGPCGELADSEKGPH